jgi:hypothetical protein
MTEEILHNHFRNNQDLKQSFLNLLGLPLDSTFRHEHNYPNNLAADFSIIHEGRIKAIVELKGSNIGVTDYVRGIGQIFQYQHFADKNINIANNLYDNVKSILCFPSQLLINNTFSPGLFLYPEKSMIIEVNELNLNPRILDKNTLYANAISALNDDLISISPYYIRDNRLYEIHLCLKYLNFLVAGGREIINRVTVEREFLRNLNTRNNGNWRNAFISLSSLGLIDGSNKPTRKGIVLANTNYENFAFEIYQYYIKPYIDTIINALFINDDNPVEISYNDLKFMINNQYHNNTIQFLTESDNRYLSSWFNIMRDDYGMIDFDPRQDLRRLIYRPYELINEALILRISNHTKSRPYYERYNQLINI